MTTLTEDGSSEAPAPQWSEPDWLDIPAGTIFGDAIYAGNLVDGSPEWHAFRNRPGAIGGSEVANVLNIPGRFKSPYVQWLEKAGYKESDEISPETQELFDWGHRLEPAIIEAFTEMTGLSVARTGSWVNSDRPWHGANPDGFVLDHNGIPVGILECKYSIRGSGYENGACPAKYVAQARYYMACFGLSFGYLACFSMGKLSLFMIPATADRPVTNLRTGETEYHQYDASTMLPMVQDFVDSLATNQPPALTGSDDELDWKLSRHPEIDGKDVVIPYELAVEYAEARDNEAEATAKLKLAKAKMLEVMGTAKMAKAGYPDGKVKAKSIASRRPVKGGGISLVAIGKSFKPEPYELIIEDTAAPAAA